MRARQFARLPILLVAGALLSVAACGSSADPPTGSSAVTGSGAVGTGGNSGTGAGSSASTSGSGGASSGGASSGGASSGGASSGGASSGGASSSASGGGTSSGAGGSASASGSGGGCVAPPPAVSDSFDGASLDPAWSVLNPALVTSSVSGGELALKPTQYLLWYNQNQGTLVSKLVTGDFKATATVRARRASNPALPPDKHIHLGGLMARNPAGPPENYVFIVVGNDENDLSVETKTTVNSASSYAGPSWPSGDAELRICRLGAAMHLYKREIGAASWTLATTYDRPDLPATLEVGPNVYAAASPPDLVVTFEEVEFAGVCDLAGCAEDG